MPDTLIEYIRDDGTILRVNPNSVAAAEQAGWKLLKPAKAEKPESKRKIK